MWENLIVEFAFCFVYKSSPGEKGLGPQSVLMKLTCIYRALFAKHGSCLCAAFTLQICAVGIKSHKDKVSSIPCHAYFIKNCWDIFFFLFGGKKVHCGTKCFEARSLPPSSFAFSINKKNDLCQSNLIDSPGPKWDLLQDNFWFGLFL